MSANPLEPLRLRTSTARPSSVGGRLAHQIRILSAHPQIPRPRRIPHVARPGRLLLAAVRVTVATVILLAVVSGAGATVLLIIHRIHPTALTRSEPRAVPTDTANRPRSRRSAEHPSPSAETQVTAPPTPLVPAERPVPVAEPGQVRPPRPSAKQPSLLGEGPWEGPSDPPRASAARRSPPALTRLQTEVAVPKALPVRTFRSTALEPAPTLAPAPSTAAIAEEATLLRQALTALRQGRNAKRALELLGAYDLRFPRGTLAPEAGAARAQALLLTGDKRGALAVFDRLSLEQGGQAGELRVVRGELRSLAGRCKEALVDFGMVLQQTAGIPPEERARALYGQASCRARTGDSAGAEQDRQRYLREYPQGPAGPLLRSQP
jgi:TolA-binding protein